MYTGNICLAEKRCGNLLPYVTKRRTMQKLHIKRKSSFRQAGIIKA